MIIDFIKQSISLDISFFRISNWSFDRKIKFIFAKYSSIIRHFFASYELGESHTRFDGHDIYYDNKYGIAELQRILSSHNKLISLADIKTNSVKTIFDIGANVGFFTMFIKDKFQGAQVFAFEPIKQTYDVLVKNTEQFNNVKCFNEAFSSSKGYAFMDFNPQESALSTMNSTGSVKVLVDTIDNFVKNQKISSIDLLKIDAECSELDILLGAKKILSRTKYIYMELTLKDNNRYTIASLFSALVGDGYDFNLVGYRNFVTHHEGEMPIFDVFLVNKKFIKNGTK